MLWYLLWVLYITVWLYFLSQVIDMNTHKIFTQHVGCTQEPRLVIFNTISLYYNRISQLLDPYSGRSIVKAKAYHVRFPKTENSGGGPCGPPQTYLRPPATRLFHKRNLKWSVWTTSAGLEYYHMNFYYQLYTSYKEINSLYTQILID